MRLAWVCPISSRTGVGSYAQSVLRALTRRPGLEVVVLHPPCPADERLQMPCPTLPLSDALVQSDLSALFDLMLYHLGNNDLHHGMILRALMAHPGPVVLHDHVYQHMLAGLHHDGTAPAPGFGALVHAVSGAQGFAYLAASGVLRNTQPVSYVPWESSWAAQVPLSNLLARLGTGVITHSDYAARALGAHYPGSATTLFMPRPDVPVDPPERSPGPTARLRLAATGHIGPTKGFDLLIDALASAPDLADRFSVTIAGHAGDAAYMQVLETRIAAQGLTGSIHILPDPDAAAFRDVMQDADLFLNLRRPNTEGASLSLAEQLASGRPVIVQNSGCFAEMPATCGWHLPEDAGPEALADLMRAIAADPRQITKRGKAAAHVMGPLSADAYAEKLATFLCAGQTRMARRAATARARTTPPDPQDQDWLTSYVQVRGLMAAVLAGTGYLPPDLWSYPEADVGQYVALNLLNTDIPEGDAAPLGHALLQGGPLAATARLGLLRQLLARGSGTPGDVPHHLSDLALPVRDVALWEALLCLPAPHALPLALQALGLRPDPDVQTQLREEAGQIGLGQTLFRYLATQNNPLLTGPDMQAVRQCLDSPDTRPHAPLQEVPLRVDLVALAQGNAPQAPQVTGCHPPEESGIWTAQPTATLRLHLTHPAMRLEGQATFHDVALARSDQQVTIEVTEEATGRATSWQDTRLQGGDPHLDWMIPLPHFTGALRVTITLPACHSPLALGSSADPRPLGLLLQHLRFDAAVEQLEAAE